MEGNPTWSSLASVYGSPAQARQRGLSGKGQDPLT